MLIQRVKKENSWEWELFSARRTFGIDYLIADIWEIFIVGSYGPNLPSWIRSKFQSKNAPLEILQEARNNDDGHYALIFINRKSDNVYICSDPYAIAKIYWWSKDGQFVFGTDLPTVLRAVSPSRLQLDEGACNYYFIKSYFPGRHTFHKNVYKVPPASLWRIFEGEKKEKHYVDLMTSPDLGEDQYVSEVTRVLRESIKKNLRQFNNPILALSGGIDSTLLLSSFIDINGSVSNIEARTGVVIGGKDSKVLNPDDQKFAKRIAREFGVKHTEVYHDLNCKDLNKRLTELVGIMGTEAAVGALMFQSIGGGSQISGNALFAAQNADSILSFQTQGSPKLNWSWSPRITGLGGWCQRYNLFGRFDQHNGLDSKLAKLLMDLFLRRTFKGISWKQLSALDRVIGLIFNPERWPVPAYPDDHIHLRDCSTAQNWFVDQYWDEQFLDEFKKNPHGVFLYMYLMNYMQGTANKGTVWSATMAGQPTFLPFASKGILDLTARLKPGFKSCWFGKLPVIEISKKYNIPDYVVNREDPSTPELDLLYNETIINNEGVASYFEMLVNDCPKAVRQLETVLDAGWIESVKDHINNRDFKGLEAGRALLLFWLLEIENQAWNQGNPLLGDWKLIPMPES